MNTRLAALVIPIILLVPPAYCAEGPSPEVRLKTKVLDSLLSIPSGVPVKVRLKSAETFRGKMGELTDNGFPVQRVSEGKIVSQVIGIDDVQSVRLKQKGGVWKSILGVTSLLTLAGTVASLVSN